MAVLEKEIWAAEEEKWRRLEEIWAADEESERTGEEKTGGDLGNGQSDLPDLAGAEDLSDDEEAGGGGPRRRPAEVERGGGRRSSCGFLGSSRSERSGGESFRV